MQDTRTQSQVRFHTSPKAPRGTAVMSREDLTLLHTTAQQRNAEDGAEP